jgi:hypothetical protein
MTVIVICAIIGYIIYLRATYICETITSGEGYGFKIGDTKEQVYNKTAELFKDGKVFILYPLNEQDFGPHKQIKFESQEYKLIEDSNVWEFYFNEGFFDSIRFTFKDDCLVKIHRHRQYFELP